MSMDTITDNRERQTSELTLLSTMYPSEFSWRTSSPPDLTEPLTADPVFALTLHPSYTLDITLPSGYPSAAKPNVYLSCGGSVDTPKRKEARAALSRIVEDQESGIEILDLITIAFMDLLANFTSSPDELGKQSTDKDTRPSHGYSDKQNIKQVVIWSHHLLATSKRRDIQAWSRELNLDGFARPGHPGAVFAEGEEDQVEEFVRRLKALRWQALQVRAENTVATRVLGHGEGVVEVESLGEIAERLKATDTECATMFLEGMKISGATSH